MNITFFIPAYNCAKTINEAVESILKTNFKEGDELIIVNDFSTDGTATALNTLKGQYPIITLLEHKRNKGGAAARNTAIENSKHELLFCLDSDNVLAASTIAPLKEYLIKTNADVAVFQNQHFFKTDKSQPQYIWTLPEGNYQLESYLEGKNSPGQHGNYLFTKSSWVKAMGYAEGCSLDTWTFGLRQAITGAKMVVLKDTLYYHRLTENSYWMRDLEAHLWSVSVKATYALFPFYDRIDESFLKYMQGKGRYTWYYNLQNKPMKLVAEGSKDVFYARLQKELRDFVYPGPSLLQRTINKLKRILGDKNDSGKS